MDSHNTGIRAARSLRTLPMTIAAFAAISILHACGNDETETVAGNVDPENFATMTSTQVSTLISDSGITRYRIDTPLWLVFDQASEPRWTFPQGMHLEKYDNFFRIDATVDCDSATYFKEKQLWRLDGYVDIANMANEKFLTQQLFWDQRDHKIYSDSFIHIERADRIIEGYGFVSNEKMTQYRVINVSGIFPVEKDNSPSDNGHTQAADSAQTDTVQTQFGVQGRPGLRPSLPRSSQRRKQPEAEPTPEILKPATAPAPRKRKPVKKLDPNNPVILTPEKNILLKK